MEGVLQLSLRVRNFLIAGFTRTPFPIIDSTGRIVAVLAGQPGTDYAEELMEAFKLFQQEGKKAGLGRKDRRGSHKRGEFPAYNRGTTMGMGSPHPVALDNKGMADVLTRLVGHNSVRRMAIYQNGTYCSQLNTNAER